MDESNIPIDIHAHKLVDWLVSRRHCKKDWLKALTDIRDKIRTALEDMPEDPRLAQILSKQHYRVVEANRSRFKEYFWILFI